MSRVGVGVVRQAQSQPMEGSRPRHRHRHRRHHRHHRQGQGKLGFERGPMCATRMHEGMVVLVVLGHRDIKGGYSKL